MLPWWGWVLLWVLLVLGGAVLVGLRARATWRSLRALTAELGRAGRLVEELEQAAARQPDPEPPVTAVLQDPHSLREEHRRERARQADARRTRNAERMPPWARVH